ncbi:MULTISPECIES: hypothetical protein [Streptomyces]|uniref:Uncharacterized protein n=1 Tax=Streptomyces sp. NBC_00093 TaxID=2975649 RepID=A0AAU1ZRY4_9ACTN|nr:hypothetical protein [Streptomyces sp. GQFP]UIX28697.1 hypothetical protein LUX31_00920 [Streptomyces sp. GQFP]
MPIKRSDSSSPSDDSTTPDALLHTGSEHGASAEDLVLATGRDVTPRSLAWAERKLAEEGSAALDKLLP